MISIIFCHSHGLYTFLVVVLLNIFNFSNVEVVQTSLVEIQQLGKVPYQKKYLCVCFMRGQGGSLNISFQLPYGVSRTLILVGPNRLYSTSIFIWNFIHAFVMSNSLNVAII